MKKIGRLHRVGRILDKTIMPACLVIMAILFIAIMVKNTDQTQEDKLFIIIAIFSLVIVSVIVLARWVVQNIKFKSISELLFDSIVEIMKKVDVKGTIEVKFLKGSNILACDVILYCSKDDLNKITQKAVITLRSLEEHLNLENLNIRIKYGETVF